MDGISHDEAAQALRRELAEARAELAAARRQQAASAEVLRIVSRSSADAAPVLDAILDACLRLFSPYGAAIYLVDGEWVKGAARRGFADGDWGTDATPLAGSSTGRAIAERRPVHIADLAEVPGFPEAKRAAVQAVGGMTTLYAPMISGERGVGSLVVARKPKRPFSQAEIAALAAFADQAVIAIENARLFAEINAALAQQRASADILSAVSQSVEDSAPVFERIVEACGRLFGAQNVAMFRIGEDGNVRMAAGRGPLVELGRRDVTPLAESYTGQVARTRKVLHIPDQSAEPGLSDAMRARLRQTGGVSLVYAPILAGERALGSIGALRSPPRPFSPQEVALAETFADQAAIAIRNADLFREVRDRTRELEAALERQKATSQILEVIASSPADPAPVFEAIATSANAVVRGRSTGVYRFIDGRAHLMAMTSLSPEGDAAMRATFPLALSEFPPFALVSEGGVAEIPDTELVDNAPFRDLARVRGYRSVALVPLVRRGAPIGLLSATRAAPGAFAPADVASLRAFADQAVIAIENATLFEEVQRRTRALEEALAQQTATSDVLRVISRSPSDLKPVLDAIADTAARLSGSEMTMFFRFDGEAFRILASWNFPPDVQAMLEAKAPGPGHPSALGRAGATLKPAYIPDVLADPDYGLTVERDKARYRATLAAPMLREGRLVGALSLNRSEPGSFTDKHIELVSTFADQAAIAFENVRLFEEVRERTREVEQALKQQTTTSEILRVISQSPTDARPVFESIVVAAAKLLKCDMAFVMLVEGERWRNAAVATPQGLAELALTETFPIDPAENFPSRAILAKETIYLPDWSRIELPAHQRRVWSLYEVQSSLHLPLLREGACVGVLTFLSRRAHGFGDAEIAQCRAFRDQALIAMENARLFNETQEALAQQTATADVLKVISRSAFDLQTVLDTLARSAVELSGAVGGAIHIREGDSFPFRGSFGSSPQFVEFMRGRPAPTAGRGSVVGRVALSGKVEAIPDVLADPEFDIPIHAVNQTRSVLGVPMLRDNSVEGVFVLARPNPGEFSPRLIELVQTFADQAVIAIENARLFDEVQAKTRDLEASLERQTAMAEILEVISNSPTDAKPVFDAISLTAVRLFRCGMAGVFRVSGDKLIPVTAASPERLFRQDELSPPLPIDPAANFPSRAVVAKATVRCDYAAPDTPDWELFVKQRYGMKSAVFLPLLRGQECIGVFLLMADRRDAFDDSDVALAESFRDQALIAVENARLFNETQEALAQQTATADVLKTISRSAFDLQTVLETLIATAVDLNEAETGTICVRDGDVFRYRAFRAGAGANGLPRHLADNPIRPDRGTIAGRAILSGQIEQIPDVLADSEFRVPLASLGNPSRALVAAPLIGKQGIEGALVLARREPGLCMPRQIETLKTFADQAVIAIENARLLAEVQARTRELEQSLADLRQAQDRLVQSEKLASLGQLTAGIAHEIKNPLNFVNNFAALSRDLIGEMKEALALGPSARAEVEELAGLIDSNLEKVVHHGRRADSIVKNMLLHSREGSGERSRVSVNAMVEEALNLAYHGARAERPGFNVTLEKALDPAAGEVELYLQEITRVLLNLIGNGFYATAQRRETQGPDYQPTLKATTRAMGERVEIRIRDNGAGVPDEVRAKMFNPFFTTKPAGEGTGLGLSLSHDIVVKQHGGTIEVETAAGEFAEFVVTLPRGGAGS